MNDKYELSIKELQSAASELVSCFIAQREANELDGEYLAKVERAVKTLEDMRRMTRRMEQAIHRARHVWNELHPAVVHGDHAPRNESELELQAHS